TIVNPDNPEDKVVRIRMYRVIHSILDPNQLSEGVSPKEKWLYVPYFQGEYGWVTEKREGEPDKQSFKLLNPDDPFLYWVIPIYRNPANPKVVVDCLERHAKEVPTTSPQDVNKRLPIQ